MDNVLYTIKKLLGLPNNYDYFDSDVLVDINMVLPVLKQLGVQLDSDLVSDESKWEELSSSIDVLNIIKPYIFLRVRMVFDPPSNSALFDAIQKRIDELEWRINLLGEGDD